MHLYIREHLTLYIYIYIYIYIYSKHINGIKKKEYTNKLIKLLYGIK